MRRFIKTLAYIVVGLAILLAVAITFTIGWRPFIGPKARPLTDRKFEATPERLARGEQLFDGCMGCHSLHDWTPHDPPILPGMKGAGMVMPGASKVCVSRSVDVGYSMLRTMPPVPVPLGPDVKVTAKPTRLLASQVPGVVVLPGGSELTLNPMPA